MELGPKTFSPVGSSWQSTGAPSSATTVIDMGKQKNGGNGVFLLDGKGVDPAEKKN